MAPERSSACASSSRRSAMRARESVAPLPASHGDSIPAGGRPAKTVTTVAVASRRPYTERTASSRCGETITSSDIEGPAYTALT